MYEVYKGLRVLHKMCGVNIHNAGGPVYIKKLIFRVGHVCSLRVVSNLVERSVSACTHFFLELLEVLTYNTHCSPSEGINNFEDVITFHCLLQTLLGNVGFHFW